MNNKLKEHILFLLSNVDALFELQKTKKEESQNILVQIAELKADSKNKSVLELVDKYRVVNSYILLLIEDMKLKISEIVTLYSFVKTTGETIEFEEDVRKRLESFTLSNKAFFAFSGGKVQHKDTDFVDKLANSVKKSVSGNKELFLENFKKSQLYAEHTSKGVDKTVQDNL